MVIVRRWPLILLVLLLGVGQLHASEQRDFTAAAAAFQAGLWDRAAAGFADFVKKYPDSARVPQAVLIEAQADYNAGKMQDAIALLDAHESTAGPLGDQYAYWIGEAQFTNADYQGAIQTFAQLADTFKMSPRRLDAVINEADAYGKLDQWTQATDLLQKPGGIFQQQVATNATDGRVLRGQLLLAQGLMNENHPRSAITALQPSPGFDQNAELNWQRLFLLSQAQMANGEADNALATTATLMDAANRARRPDLWAQSVAQRAEILEKIGRLSDAESAYAQNLTNSVPTDWQRQAILKIAELSAAQTNFVSAETSLEDFQSQFTNSPDMDSVLLALGELHLKSYVARPSRKSDDLTQAQNYFDQFINTYTNSSLLGKAYLDRGWCFWIEQSWTESASDFQLAVQTLPKSVDLAVAHYKLGDAAFKANDFTNALANYQAVVQDFTNNPEVQRSMVPMALYQALRVSLVSHDRASATNAVDQILKIYPRSNVAEKSLLIEGEAFSDWNDPVEARDLFQKLEQQFPDSSQLPDIEMAIAKTYEREENWPQAISVYENWLKRFSVNTNFVADVQYARAWANFKAGRETNAFILFTNFLAEFPSNQDLTPVAQWWLGDYYYGRGDWVNAEENYELVFDNFTNSTLAYPALLMAGQSAMGRQGYDEALRYFKEVIGQTTCPPQLDQQTWNGLLAQAWFQGGDVLMQEPSSDTNNPLANFNLAISYFTVVCQDYAGSEQAALAYGEIGDCYLQLATQSPKYYNDATNAYHAVMDTPGALVPERSKAQYAIGMVFEKRAALDPANQTNLLNSALNNYLDVFFGNNLRDGETADPDSVKQAGLRALPLMQTLGKGYPDKFINQMETMFPQMKSLLEKKRLEFSLPRES